MAPAVSKPLLMICGDDDFAVQHAARRQLRQQGLHHFGKIAIQRLFIATLDFQFVAVAENQGTKAVPFRFKDPLALGRELIHSLCQHRQHRWIHGKLHAPWYIDLF